MWTELQRSGISVLVTIKNYTLRVKQSPLSKSVGPNCPHIAFTFVDLLFFPLKSGEDQKKAHHVRIATIFPPKKKGLHIRRATVLYQLQSGEDYVR